MPARKYGNKIVVVDNHKFDSKEEAKYYDQLKWLLQAKQIKSFKLQPKYLLQEAFKKNGKTFRKIEYIADFEIHNLDGSIEVVDVNGVETEAFKIKRKLFEMKYPYKLSLITYELAFGGWIDLEELKKLKRKPQKKVRAKKIGKPKT
ncbi:DUF1064 domain-containing protein [Metabacillus bambusae]|uniref:DUF1064 domain-containing protein n=1 Tax=Metabacillus bambusae TaxID=2795218 RepID=A0ABS3N9R2_9BACI|nr:DUF1064 domain-containing protein [Metabacillus bambusae]MBO1515027.1 DUF1064 domain-containing protein [Metabacillus bambusae]